MEKQPEQAPVAHDPRQGIVCDDESKTSDATVSVRTDNTTALEDAQTDQRTFVSPQGARESSPSYRRSQTSTSKLSHRDANQASVTTDSSARPKKRVIDPSQAIKRGLSFGPLKKPGSRQNSDVGIVKPSPSKSPSRLSQRSASSGSDVLSITGLGRLKKDRFASDAEEERAVESSDDELQADSSDDESSGLGRSRGRKREDNAGQRTLLKSLLVKDSEDGPAVTITAPASEKPVSTSKRFIVRPNTNYDQNVSRGPSPSTSDSEELNDIRRAQRLNINSSPVDSSIPHRVIQTIIRGDFARMQREVEEGIRRSRTYLVATDLSGEAAYALEWTIGTVLRDGDTLLAVYAVDEEVGTGATGDCLPIGEGARAIQDTTAVMERMTVASQRGALASLSPLSKAAFRSSSRKSSAANSTDSRAVSRAEYERSHAIEKLSETCLKFLRKTKLQVRIAIEVIHCKSPKYMITEAIDGLKPTLVIIGSRGRSALKGVLLGSFSNYLVTKSSAPVMVARKKLSGRKTKIVTPNVRLANNLTPSRRLAEAKID